MKKQVIKLFVFTSIALTGIGFIGNNYFNIVTAEEYTYPPINDPYYTGENKIPVSESLSVYQNISMDYIGDIESIWKQYRGDNVTIAIIDTGVDYFHPDLEGKILADSACIQNGVFVSSDLDKIFPNYDSETGSYQHHGTNTAGVALASSNQIGTVGIAPNANLLAIKVDLLITSVCVAIRYAADHGADIINLSLGIYAEPYTDNYLQKDHFKENEDYFPNIDKVIAPYIDYAHSKNCIIVAAAGNEKNPVHCFPASNNHVIGVGALNVYRDNEPAVFCNYNGVNDVEGSNCNVDIMATGYVVAPSYNGSHDYILTQGTSFSTPIVAGAAALWKQKYPDGTPDEFMQDLKLGAVDIGQKGWDRTFGYGRLDVYSLLNKGERPPKKQSGCRGNIQVTSLLISSTLLVIIPLIIIKRKRYENKK